MKRYRPSGASRGVKDPGYILLFAHGTGFHKEQWEPAIERLFANDKAKRSQNNPSQILESWSIDCQNMGAGALVNEELLVREPGVLSIHDYADAFVALYESGLLGNLEKGLQKVVLLGHSAGTVASVFAAAHFDPPSTMPFHAMILVEPCLFAPAMAEKHTPMYQIVEQMTPLRREFWESREAAHKWMKSRPPWNVWDSRNLALYVEYGLRPLPTILHPGKAGVALSCSPADEFKAFGSTKESLKAVDCLGKICDVIPVHLVFSARDDMFSREQKDSLNNPSQGRVFSSVSRVSGAGHLVVQEKPDLLADVIYAILNDKLDTTSSSSQYPKL